MDKELMEQGKEKASRATALEAKDRDILANLSKEFEEFAKEIRQAHARNYEVLSQQFTI